MKIMRRGHRLLLMQAIVLMLVVFAAFTTYMAWRRAKRIHWKKSLSWYPRLDSLIQDIDNFFWDAIDAEGLSVKSITKDRNLSETFEHIRISRSRLLLKNREKKEEVREPKPKPGFIDPGQLPLEYCPEEPPGLKGWVDLPDFWRKEPPMLTELAKKYPNHNDATSKPFDCKARYRVAIIIPLRGREIQLRGLLLHMHPIWQRQQVDYTVYTITQAGKQLFNRAKLMNVGFAEAMKDRKYDCYVFHDVDLLVENDRCLYWCPPLTTDGKNKARHLSTYIDKFGYSVHSYNLGLCSPMTQKNMEMEVFGGISMYTEEQFVAINGFSNLYWGWGAEDDDLYMRTRRKGYEVFHETSGACSYHMIYHKHERKNRKSAIRYLLLKHALSRQNEDGLSNLRYKVLSREKHSIYTNITVDIGGPSQRLRDITKKIARGDEYVDDMSCFESLVWMYNKLVKKPLT